ncbi:hypothetical protein T492DRAFT_1145320, partial [Pavlovales sp. CCMP2436]
CAAIRSTFQSPATILSTSASSWHIPCQPLRSARSCASSPSTLPASASGTRGAACAPPCTNPRCAARLCARPTAARPSCAPQPPWGGALGSSGGGPVLKRRRASSRALECSTAALSVLVVWTCEHCSYVI